MNVREAWKNLPAVEIAGQVNAVLAANQCAVITAPPGAGKSTLLPLTILEGMADGTIPMGKILMLEPRRLAARQIACRMADMIDEQVGETVGYRIRFENKVSASTRIEVLTEGILTRMLIQDPTLEGVSVIIFDEFHERSLVADEGLALSIETQQIIRPDLKLVVMSATIDTDGICSFLKAPHIEGKGRSYPVTVRYADVSGGGACIPDIPASMEADSNAIAERVSQAIRYAHSNCEGSILAFLPGQAEITKCADILDGMLGNTHVYPLYGMLSYADQRAAIAPCRDGERKVVLATNIAETSLTIEGITVVVDSGLCRKMVFNPQNGLSQMKTVRISTDMADQRAGRSGRTAPGTCYRLWTAAVNHNMEPCRKPQILEDDLSPLVLDLAAWGSSDIENMMWLTRPEKGTVIRSRRLLQSLGALKDNGAITDTGKKISGMPCHPRIARMLLSAETAYEKALACDLAAILEEKDPLSGSNVSNGGQPGIMESDAALRISGLRRFREGERISGSASAWKRIERIAEQYRYILHVKEDNSTVDSSEVGKLIAYAYPERIAHAQPGTLGMFQLACGDMVQLDHSDYLAGYEWIVVASMNAQDGKVGRAYLASACNACDLEPLMTIYENVSWDSRSGKVIAEKQWRLGRLVVKAVPVDGGRERIVDIICQAARKEGLSIFDFNDKVALLQNRISVVAEWHPELGLPEVGDQVLLETAANWLPLYIGNATKVEQLRKIDMAQVIWGLLDYDQQQAVERLAPQHVTVPTGSRIAVEYRKGAQAPVLRVRLQECFGMTQTPRVDDGRRPMLMELLSPGYKPVQLTQDLANFWRETYFEVRKELKRRYPKHAWPDDPLTAPAVRK